MAGFFWYRWYFDRFLGSTYGWSVTAKGVYRELLDAQWRTKLLPKEPKAMQGLIHATDAEWAEFWPQHADKVPVSGKGRRNAALEKVRAESEKLHAGAVEKAKGAAAARWLKEHDNAAPHDAPSNATSNTPSNARAMLSSARDQELEKDPPVLASPPPSRAGTDPPQANGAGRPKGPGEDRIKTPPGYPEPIGDIAKRAIARMRKSAGVKTDDDLPPIA